MAKDLCGIYIGPDEIRAISLTRKRGEIALASAVGRGLEGEELEAPGAALKATLKRMKGVPESAAVCLSKEHVTLIHTSLPSPDPVEIAEMARFEAERQIPFNAERHSIGHQVIRSTPLGSEALLAAADGPHVERALKAVHECGLRPEGLNVSSACLVNALLYAMPEVARTKTVALVSIGVNTLDLVFCAEGRILFSRSVPHGLKSLARDWSGDEKHLAVAARMIDMLDLDPRHTEGHPHPGDTHPEAARQWANRLIQELRLSYDYARREKSCPAIDLIALVGEGASVRRLDRYMHVNLGVECVALNPVGALPGAAEAGMAFGGNEMTVAFGAAIQRIIDGAYTIDLTPRAYYRQIERKALAQRLMVVGALALFTAALGAAAWLEMRDRTARLAGKYEVVNNRLRPVVQSLREQSAQLEILETFFDDPGNAIAALEHVVSYEDAPTKVSIKSITYEKGVQTVVEGHAIEIPDINNYAHYLRKAPFFDDVQVVEQPKRRALAKRDEVYVFRIQCRMKEFKAKRSREKLTDDEILAMTEGIEPEEPADEGAEGPGESVEPGAEGGAPDGAAPTETETHFGAAIPPALSGGVPFNVGGSDGEGMVPAQAQNPGQVETPQ